ncbi:hypothetical protein GIB67_040855 [Kingdonia uniflora]|uniref:Transposase MuDR plant domain-containing protein n=1 Tax=Kingdonia uniflora TaxID=39325 RepID=A0A7J7L813_9MAGN|nr:hypothetical protein GIB67_040855 [Kingdonia uniflora]
MGGPSNDVEAELGRPCLDVNEGETGGMGANKGKKKRKSPSLDEEKQNDKVKGQGQGNEKDNFKRKIKGRKTSEGGSSVINAKIGTKNAIEDVDEVEDWTRWAKLNPDCLDAKENYYRSHSSQQDGVQLKKKPDVNYDELKIGMMWPTVFETRKFIRHYGIVNKFQFYQVKNENYRARLKCSDEDCQWMFYARRMPDDQTFKLKGTSNLIHNCKGKGRDTKKLANAPWNIRVRFGVDISYYTAWSAWATCMERIVGSYDEGYIIMPELAIQMLKENLGSIATCSIDFDDTNQRKTTCIAYKASIDGFLNRGGRFGNVQSGRGGRSGNAQSGRGGSTTTTQFGRGTSSATTQSKRGASASTTIRRGGVNNTSTTRRGSEQCGTSSSIFPRFNKSKAAKRSRRQLYMIGDTSSPQEAT